MENLFTEDQEQEIIDAIQKAELKTTGEIRLHIENRCKGDALKRAQEVFGKLHMHETEQHNGVIIYIAIKEHKIAIWGDKGIHEQVGQQYWDEILYQMIYRFKHRKYAKGIIEAINSIGEQLANLFPYQSDDKNELPDEISYHKN